MLTIRGLVSGYLEGIDILKHVDLNVNAGSITGIIGPNGAGKSTLLKSVFGFLRAREGEILLEGVEIQNSQPHMLKKAGISYMLQEFSTFPNLSVLDNLLIGCWVFRHNRKLVKERLNEIYSLFPVLSQRSSDKASYLSGGLLRMLSLAKEVMTKPKLMLVDEPSAGLAPKVVKDIYVFLDQIREQGTTILLVDQNIVKALDVSSYMYMLEMGKVKRHGPKEDFEVAIREIIRDSLMAK
jgi:branched-chain amino acid transport system ATP-binding protein